MAHSCFSGYKWLSVLITHHSAESQQSRPNKGQTARGVFQCSVRTADSKRASLVLSSLHAGLSAQLRPASYQPLIRKHRVTHGVTERERLCLHMCEGQQQQCSSKPGAALPL